MGYQRDLLPSFAGINTFARSLRGDIGDLSPGMVGILGVTHDGTSSSRQGVRQGPRSIREASADFIFDVQSSSAKSIINVLTGRTIKLPEQTKLLDLGDLPVYPMDLQKMTASCRNAISSIVTKGAFPVILGGDHYITYPLIKGFCQAKSGKVGFIQLSSQLDLGDRDAVWGKEWHGATVRRILGDDLVEAQNTVFVGTQGYIPFSDWELANHLGATVITADSVRERGIENTALKALQQAGRGCDSIYLSVDVDVVDSGYSSGTGEIIIGGLTPAELLALMVEFSKCDAVGALDMVEVAPTLDLRGRTQRLAAEAIIELIAPRVFFG